MLITYHHRATSLLYRQDPVTTGSYLAPKFKGGNSALNLKGPQRRQRWPPLYRHNPARFTA